MSPFIKQTDVKAERGVEFLVNHSGSSVWINIDGICALRVVLPDNGLILIEDDRPTELKGRRYIPR